MDCKTRKDNFEEVLHIPTLNNDDNMNPKPPLDLNSSLYKRHSDITTHIHISIENKSNLIMKMSFPSLNEPPCPSMMLSVMNQRHTREIYISNDLENEQGNRPNFKGFTFNASKKLK